VTARRTWSYALTSRVNARWRLSDAVAISTGDWACLPTAANSCSLSLKKGVADNVASIGGRTVAMEAKFVGSGGWAESIRNPASAIGTKPFALAEQARMLEQAKAYSAAFDDVVYHSNSAELIQHYSLVFRQNGLTNVKWVLVPSW
jgi:hypothetical protein